MLFFTTPTTYGQIISKHVFIACLPTIIMASWMQSSTRQPPVPHYRCEALQLLAQLLTKSNSSDKSPPLGDNRRNGYISLGTQRISL